MFVGECIGQEEWKLKKKKNVLHILINQKNITLNWIMKCFCLIFPPWLSSIFKMVTISYLEQFRHSTVPLKVVSLFSKKYCVCSLMQLSLCGISDRPSSCSTANKTQSQFNYSELQYLQCFFELMLLQCLNNPCWSVNEPKNTRKIHISQSTQNTVKIYTMLPITFIVFWHSETI